MIENTKGQNLENRNERTNESSEKSEQPSSGKNVSADQDDSTHLSEQTPGLGRTRNDSGFATKKGVTGSDYDGQVTGK